MKVFRTGLLDSAAAADIGVSTVPLQRLHGDAATVALERAGATVVLGARVRAVRAGGEVQLEDGVEEADAVVVAVPHQAVARLAPPGAVDAAAMDALGSSPIVNLHVHYDRRVLDEPFAAAVGSPVQWLFDRTASSGVTEGQLVAVSLSGAVADIGEPVAALRERYLPGAGSAPAGGARGARARLRRHARAARDVPRRTRQPPPATRHSDGRPRPLPRRRVDRHRLARDDGGRGA